MSWIELLVLVLAVNEMIELLRHGEGPGHLLARFRAFLDESSSGIARMLRCGFCLAPWLGGALVCWLYWLLPNYYEATDHSPPVDPQAIRLTWISLYGLAIARAANLLNDVTHRWHRTPGSSAWLEQPLSSGNDTS